MLNIDESRDQTAIIKDLGSKNGCKINNKRLKKDTWYPLNNGAVVCFGEVTAEYVSL